MKWLKVTLQGQTTLHPHVLDGGITTIHSPLFAFSAEKECTHTTWWCNHRLQETVLAVLIWLYYTNQDIKLNRIQTKMIHNYDQTMGRSVMIWDMTIKPSNHSVIIIYGHSPNTKMISIAIAIQSTILPAGPIIAKDISITHSK